MTQTHESLMIIQQLVEWDDFVTEVLMHNKMLLISLTCQSSDPKSVIQMWWVWSKCDL